MKLNLFPNKSFAVDLGNNNTVVTDKDKTLLSQRSYIAFNTSNNSVRAVGDEAFSMFEKTHDDLRTVKPLRGGVIADYESASRMLHELVHKVYSGSWFTKFDNVISGVPYHTTEVERRALRSALEQFNSRNTWLIHEPVAAALGLDMDIREPNGKLLIDIGGGITEIVVISLSGIAAFQSLKVAGDSFDVAIQDHFRRAYNMAIGLKTAEQIKINTGSVIADLSEAPEPMMVKGKDMVKGIPAIKKITYQEVAEILDKSMTSIELSILQTLETCPPELAADIYHNGIYITGGGAMLRGLRQRFENKIRLKVHIDPEPLFSVSKGISKVLQEPRKYRSVLFH